MIQVVYKNGKEDLVEQKFLDILLHIGEVQEFRRSDHWVNVTEDPIRSNQNHAYHGEDRRVYSGTELPPAMGV
ncbi:GSU3473 family protein [uncultured Desulfuromusa sp.]|uniref:GSU3473 family protein n=1 Tax=uncultured Desulfuromusa sp. TaxID=219183 RepID=UPI003748E6AC